ncbi:hypothetical protein GJ496_006805 [Pomphorhynchus laevis]|nr:hypothetical protein GJ496_006805 [Pomphorhynchus laevis]
MVPSRILPDQEQAEIYAHVHFMSYCWTNRVMPMGLRIKPRLSPIHRGIDECHILQLKRDERRILHRAEMQLLQLLLSYYSRISNIYCRRTVDLLLVNQALKGKCRKLSRVHHRKTSTQELVLNNWYPNRRVRREPQQNPLADLRTALEQKDYSVVNLSAQQLTQSQMEVLDLGLNYAITPTEFDRHKLAINVKKVATTFEGESRNAAATNTLGRQLFEKYVTKKCCDTGPINLNKQHLKELSEIRQMHDVVIKPSDKGGEAVVWSRSEYIAEAMRHLSQVAYQTATIDDLELATAAVRELLEKHASL